MPERRRAGSATSAPMIAAITAAPSIHSGFPWFPHCAHTDAPIAANESWHSEICPAKPVSGTSDNAKIANGKMRT